MFNKIPKGVGGTVTSPSLLVKTPKYQTKEEYVMRKDQIISIHVRTTHDL